MLPWLLLMKKEYSLQNTLPIFFFFKKREETSDQISGALHPYKLPKTLMWLVLEVTMINDTFWVIENITDILKQI